jgi:hypothetical protein
MAYTMKKLRKKKCYAVYNKKTKRKLSKCTSKYKAARQIRLLNAIRYGKFNKTKKNYK